MMKDEVTNSQLRFFALIVGGIFALLGFWPLIIHGENPRWWALVTTAFLVVPGILLPRSLFWIYKGWMMLGYILGWINTRIILGVIFYGVVTPIGIIRGWLGKDPMGRHLRPDLDSYRIIREPRPTSHLTKQY
jgi:Saxitoxin biosynthesis operon protein SxtJ